MVSVFPQMVAGSWVASGDLPHILILALSSKVSHDSPRPKPPFTSDSVNLKAPDCGLLGLLPTATRGTGQPA